MFPFEINQFYQKKTIWTTLKVSTMGGIRFNKKENFIVIFLDAPTPNPKPEQGHNIYHDRYDAHLGVYYYTGAGQKGDQTVNGRNRSLVYARENNTKIYFFRQYGFGGKHQYIGEVVVEKIFSEDQPDTYGKIRKVYVFLLKPIQNPIISEEDALQREIESELELTPRKQRSKNEIVQKIKQLDNLTSKRGPKMIHMVRNESEYQRYKGIIIELRQLHFEQCQVCGTKHFEKNRGVYCEVHHLVSWAESQNDNSNNLVVLCANCHRKFHYAKDEEKNLMYKKLIPHFEGMKYTIPKYVKINTN